MRILSVTHKNLAELVAQGLFREDLFYRINVIELCVPALRERPEDARPESSFRRSRNGPRWAPGRIMPTTKPGRCESGTGKGLVARMIHESGARREAAFVAVNRGAIPTELRCLRSRHLSILCGHMGSTLFDSYPLQNDVEMASLIRAGLPATALRRVGAFLGLRPAKVGPLVNINEKTLERRLKAHARLKPDESERVARLMRIISLATSTLESEEHAREWLQHPLRELDGRTPLQMTATEPGAREVERVLGRLEHGIFA